MEKFMQELAPQIWPPKIRKCKKNKTKRNLFLKNFTKFEFSFSALCYAPRGKTNSCDAKEGNPFGPFWDTYKIDFVNSSFYGPLHFDVHHSDIKNKWIEKYSAVDWPVLAFTGAPATFPVQVDNKDLQKCLVWNDKMSNAAKNFIKDKLPRGAFLGIHLRNGVDWVNKFSNKKCQISIQNL